MNLKKCKMLRRQARGMTIGKPLRQLLSIVHHRKVILGVGKDGKPTRITRVTAYNDPDSFRGKYRALKRGEIVAT